MTAATNKEAPTSSFGHIIHAILTENNGKILAKYRRQQTKQTKDLQNQFQEKRNARKRALERREMMDECHVRPGLTLNAKQEKIMRKSATYGVVALFKAVAKHQRNLKRSLDEIDSDDDILQKKTMRIEQESTKRLLHSLNASSSNNKLIEIPNPHKKHKLNNNRAAIPKHLQSILLDENNDKSKSKAKPWRVLDENMMIDSDKSHNKTKRQIMDEDSEFEDDECDHDFADDSD